MNLNIKKEYRIERLTKDKLQDVLILYRTVYRRNSKIDYWIKKYNTAYTGAEYIGYIGYSRVNEPIGYFGVIPTYIKYKRKIFLSGQAVDAMTIIDHRYKGVFVELAKNTFELCKLNGIKLLFGFPNQNSYQGLVNNLGWKIAGHMQRFKIPVNTPPFASLVQNFQWLKWIYNKYVKLVLRKYLSLDNLTSSAITEEYGGVYRDENYMSYKQYNNSLLLKILNAKTWIKIGDGLLIGDMEIKEEDFDNVITLLKNIAKRLGLTHISFQTSTDTPLYMLFSKKYKPVTSFPIIFLDIGIDIDTGKIKFTFSDIDIF